MKPVYRTMWMLPRNIRKIEPWKLVQIANIICACDAQISDQRVQNTLYSQLCELGIKVDTNLNGVVNPGGFRTYLAQLACLGFFFKDPSDNSFKLTYAGEKLISGDHPLQVLRCQLMRMQCPSVYGLGQNVRFSPTMKVKPFVFLVKLLQDPLLDFKLNDKEIGLAVIYGRTFNDYEKVVNKIISFRHNTEYRNLIDNVDDVRTPRRYHEDAPEQDLEQGITDAITIGNTFKNYLEAAMLIAKTPDLQFYELNNDPKVIAELSQYLSEPLEPLDKNALVAWQMRYGRFDKTKAVRTLSSRTNSKNSGFTTLIQTSYFSYIEEHIFEYSDQDFISLQAQKWGKSESDIAAIIEPLKNKTNSLEADTLIKASLSGGKDSLVLEKGVTAIFKQLGFDGSLHTGQKKSNREGGFPDVQIYKSGDNFCGFGDSKATSKYSFPITDTVKLETYYKHCENELENPVKSLYFVYIAGGFKSSLKTVNDLLLKSQSQYSRPVSAITVNSLLELLKHKNEVTVEKIVKSFLKGKFIQSAYEILNS